MPDPVGPGAGPWPTASSPSRARGLLAVLGEVLGEPEGPEGPGHQQPDPWSCCRPASRCSNPRSITSRTSSAAGVVCMEPGQRVGRSARFAQSRARRRRSSSVVAGLGLDGLSVRRPGLVAVVERNSASAEPLERRRERSAVVLAIEPASSARCTRLLEGQPLAGLLGRGQEVRRTPRPQRSVLRGRGSGRPGRPGRPPGSGRRGARRTRRAARRRWTRSTARRGRALGPLAPGQGAVRHVAGQDVLEGVLALAADGRAEARRDQLAFLQPPSGSSRSSASPLSSCRRGPSRTPVRPRRPTAACASRPAPSRSIRAARTAWTVSGMTTSPIASAAFQRGAARARSAPRRSAGG